MSLIAAGVACGAVLVAGCSAGTVAGEAGAVNAGSGEPVFSPCDDIPDDTLRAIGVDPASESMDILDVKQPGWTICQWTGTSYSVFVAATDRTVEEFHANPRNTDFASLTLGHREAFSYRETTDTRHENCDVVMRSGDGAAMVRFSLDTGDPSGTNPCQAAVRTAIQLEPVIPQ
ncbi:DUF3558 domain-containing protein [Rhodococcus kronopolitis]|uniref:DUF3558 domain-containing protein n=1 Tax=Rhodococcus kronopolitis TaxID=1460226 RepID=A0ABV9FXT0_9NOCA